MAEQGFADQAFGEAAASGPTRRRSEWGCMKSCAVGCFVMLILLAIGAFIVYRSSNLGTSKDAAEVAALVKQTINADIPPGYEGKMSVNFSVFGFGFKMAIVLPTEAKFDDKDDEDPTAQGKHTMLMVFSIFGADDETLKKAFQDKRGGGLHNKVGNAPEVKLTVKVGNRDVPATKIETTQNGVATIQYQAVIKPGVLFIGMGPADKFDKKAMDAFLGSVKE